LPNAAVLEQKQKQVAEISAKLEKAIVGVVVDYKGITVEADTKLRADMRANNVEYAVVKNTLTRFAAKEVGFDELDPILNGTTALAISAEDPIAPCRMVGDFIQKNPKASFAVKGGFVEGKVVDVDTIMARSKLTNKGDLIATVLGTLNAPIAALARALNAIAEKQGAPAEAAAEATAE
jgi:large subunit ribosomal protein L10